MGSIGPAPLQFQDPVTVRISDEERVSGSMTEEHVAAAVIAFHRDGFVVLENVVDPEHCAVLDKEMCEAAERMKTDPKTIWNDVSARLPRLQATHADGRGRTSMLPRRNVPGTCSMLHHFVQRSCTKTSGQTS